MFVVPRFCYERPFKRRRITQNYSAIITRVHVGTDIPEVNYSMAGESGMHFPQSPQRLTLKKGTQLVRGQI